MTQHLRSARQCHNDILSTVSVYMAEEVELETETLRKFVINSFGFLTILQINADTRSLFRDIETRNNNCGIS